MKYLLAGLALITASLLFTSCVSYTYIVGNDFDDKKVNELEIGKTDASQVIKMFGDPHQTGQVNQYEVFMYSYEENEFKPKNNDDYYIDKRYKSLFIVFDENNRIMYFSHNVPLNSGNLDLIMNKEKMKRDREKEENMNTNHP